MPSYKVSPRYRSVDCNNMESGELCVLAQGTKIEYALCVINAHKERGLLFLQDDFRLKKITSSDRAIRLEDHWRFRLSDLNVKMFVDSSEKMAPGKVAFTEEGAVLVAGEAQVCVNLETFQIVNIDLKPGFYTDWIIEVRASDAEEWRNFYDPAPRNN